MGVEVEFEFGPRFGADTSTELPWLGFGGCQVAQDVWGTYSEVVRRGYVYSASCAAAALGAAFTTTPPISLWNPPNSQRYLAVLKSHIAITTVQTTINAVAYGAVQAQAAAPTGGASATPVNTLIGNSNTGVGKAFSASTLSIAPVQIGTAFTLPAATATNLFTSTDWVNGSILLLPGSALGMQGIVASGTGSAILTLYWAEIPMLPS